MVKDTDVKKGHSISKKFNGGQYEEIKLLRESINLIYSIIDYDSLTEEEKIVYDNFKNYNSRVEELKNG